MCPQVPVSQGRRALELGESWAAVWSNAACVSSGRREKSAEIFLVWEFNGKLPLPQPTWEEVVGQALARCCNLGFPKHKALVDALKNKRQEHSHILLEHTAVFSRVDHLSSPQLSAWDSLDPQGVSYVLSCPPHTIWLWHPDVPKPSLQTSLGNLAGPACHLCPLVSTAREKETLQNAHPSLCCNKWHSSLKTSTFKKLLPVTLAQSRDTCTLRQVRGYRMKTAWCAGQDENPGSEHSHMLIKSLSDLGGSGHGLAGMVVLSWWLDLILEVFSKLNDSMVV